MRIKKLLLHTHKLQEQLSFYRDTLGFKLLEKTGTSFTLEVGWSQLSFKETSEEHKYHFCFLIPSNRLQEAQLWLEARTPVIELEPGRKIENSQSWNADSIYFYDAGGNITEFIVRYDLNNQVQNDFDASNIICVNEIGLPTIDITDTNKHLSEKLRTQFWKGNMDRFGTNGDQEGLFLLANYHVKETWFPTPIKIKANPFQAVILSNTSEHSVNYTQGTLSID